MKKQKLSLENLRVTSFVTDLNAGIKKTIKGGVQTQELPVCNPNETDAPCNAGTGLNTCGGPCTTTCDSGLRTCTRNTDPISVGVTANCDADTNQTVGCTVVCR